MPKVVIAMPVYNGGHFLGESLECLRTQTCHDFEVRIFDNASTDETNAIASAVADRDSRFSVIRRPETIPMGPNFLKALEETDCDYFAWRADDDLSAPNYVECLVETLNANPQADLATCQIRTEKINKNKTKLRGTFRIPENKLFGTLSLMFRSHTSWLYGLFRRGVLLDRYRTVMGSMPHVWSSDHATLFPFFVDRSVALDDRTYFVQRMGGDPSRAGYTPLDASTQRQIYTDFFKCCVSFIDKSDFGSFERRLLKLALIRYASKRTFRISKMALRGITGR